METYQKKQQLQKICNKNELRRWKGLLWRWQIETGKLGNRESVHVVKTVRVCVVGRREMRNQLQNTESIYNFRVSSLD